MRALEARGRTPRRQVGCSGYRRDLAVVEPRRPGRFQLGTECDGANYHGAPSARDRDKLRQEVLAGLGWRLHRVWSTDWWQDRERGSEMEGLLSLELSIDQPGAALELRIESKMAGGESARWRVAD